MDGDSIKYAAAYMADAFGEADEKRAAGLYESAQADPTKYTLLGAGAGALVGGAGGGLMSWLRRKRDDEPSTFGSDALAGALIGGGLGAGAGALPGLLKSIQTGKEAPGPLKDPGGRTITPSPSLPGAVVGDVKGLFNARTAAGGLAGGSGAAALYMKYLRGEGMDAASGLSKSKATSILDQLGGAVPKIPKGTSGREVRDTLSKLIARSGTGGMLRGGLETIAEKAPNVKELRSLHDSWLARRLGKATSWGEMRAGQRATVKAVGGLGKIPHGKKALIAALLAGLGGATLGGKYLP